MAEDTNTWDDARVAQVHIAEGLIGIEPDMLPDHLLPEGNRPQKDYRGSARYRGDEGRP